MKQKQIEGADEAVTDIILNASETGNLAKRVDGFLLDTAYCHYRCSSKRKKNRSKVHILTHTLRCATYYGISIRLTNRGKRKFHANGYNQIFKHRKQ